MLVIDRTKAPEFRTVDKIDIIKASHANLNNNIPIYTINAGTQELVKIEFLFTAGVKYGNKPLIASTVNNAIIEGTSKYSASQIADMIDYYGAFFETEINQDHASLSLYSLNKHLEKTLPVIEQIIKDASFPQKELDTYLQNKKSRFIVNNKKVNNIARKKFAELLFGNTHPYGYNVVLEDYDKINRSDLTEYYTKFYKGNGCKIIISGKVDGTPVALLNKYFGAQDWYSSPDNLYKSFEINSTRQRKNIVVKDDALQSAIRLGRVLFNRTHPHYVGMQVLNTVLGGYFGSRLMSNIREDKGYTYGIGSGIVSLQESGYFFISTEVGVDVCADALKEIYKEIKRLREEKIPEDELNLVKSYTLGVFLRSVDGPFALAEKFKNIIEFGLGYEYYDEYINKIKNITSTDLLELANLYLREEDLIELIVGKS